MKPIETTSPSHEIKRVLIWRLSAFGDVILTSPVLTLLQKYLPQAEIHFVVKKAYADAIRHNPRVNRLHLFEMEHADELISELASLNIDYLLDLQNNALSARVRRRLRVPFSAVNKRNIDKLQMTILKRRLSLPHIVERYADALKPLGISEAPGPLEFHIPEAFVHEAEALLTNAGFGNQSFAVAVLGASYRTKQWLPDRWAAALRLLDLPVALLGGPGDRNFADEVLKHLPPSAPPVLDAVGQVRFMTSAAILDRAAVVLTHDTGLMHVAAARQKPTVAIWGNTVPEFGMKPWLVPHVNAETKGLWCRPCSKLGFGRCPFGHFRCMKELSPEAVAEAARALLPLGGRFDP